jgi:hypothetical protein
MAKKMPEEQPEVNDSEPEKQEQEKDKPNQETSPGFLSNHKMLPIATSVILAAILDGVAVNTILPTTHKVLSIATAAILAAILGTVAVNTDLLKERLESLLRNTTTA